MSLSDKALNYLNQYSSLIGSCSDEQKKVVNDNLRQIASCITQLQMQTRLNSNLELRFWFNETGGLNAMMGIDPRKKYEITKNDDGNLVFTEIANETAFYEKSGSATPDLKISTTGYGPGNEKFSVMFRKQQDEKPILELVQRTVTVSKLLATKADSMEGNDAGIRSRIISDLSKASPLDVVHAKAQQGK